jgi:CheY-like chemotaxis protein
MVTQKGDGAGRWCPRQLQVLHVEDDAAVAEMYRLGMEHAGHRVTAAPNAVAALGLVSAGGFDLLLLDMLLPGMDGLQLLRELRLRELTRQLPVMVLSNCDPGDPILAQAEEFGVLACLGKTQTPPAVLVRQIRGWLESPASDGASSAAVPERRAECA